jgi:hypothetical protein
MSEYCGAVSCEFAGAVACTVDRGRRRLQADEGAYLIRGALCTRIANTYVEMSGIYSALTGGYVLVKPLTDWFHGNVCVSSGGRGVVCS